MTTDTKPKYNADLLDSYLRIVYGVRPEEGHFSSLDRACMERLLDRIASDFGTAPRTRALVEALEAALAMVPGLLASRAIRDGFAAKIRAALALAKGTP